MPKAVPGVALLLLLVPGVAAGSPLHRGFVEVAAGAHAPVFGSRYQDLFGPGPVLGFRGGAFRPPDPGAHNAFAIEFGFEWVHPSDDVTDLPDRTYSFDEFRCLFGGRWMYFLRPGLHLYGRAVGGVEVLATGGTNTIGGAHADSSRSNAGIAAQLSFGSSWRVAGVNLGLELAIPWSSHRDDPDQRDREDLATTYDALSVDLLFTVSTQR